MNILFVASEAIPFMATGGLADVAGALPKSIVKNGNDCRVVIPLYDDISHELREGMEFVCDFNVPLSWRNQYCGVYKYVTEGVTYYFIDNEYYFKRSGAYGFYDDAERYAYFSKAALEMLNYIDFAPDIIHANDWQTALVPVYLKVFYGNIDKFRNIKTVFTIHNIQYQGKYGIDIMSDVLGLPAHSRDLIEYVGCVNMMKGAITACDRLTTVSPTYAEEIKDPWFAHGLSDVIKANEYKLTGILNGIDVDIYNPKTDKSLFENYSLKTVKDKELNKTKLREYVGLNQHEDKPLLGIVTRLVDQKGLDLIKHVFDDIVANDIQVVILGSGDYRYERFFNEIQGKYPGEVSFNYGFIPNLARKIYSGADMFLMPSKSEPCGLAQMVALRYGTIPIVRQTGGLKDSIADVGDDEGNGYTFKAYNAHHMLDSILRAKGDYSDKKCWNSLVKRAMKCDFSWEVSAKKYVEMYESCL